MWLIISKQLQLAVLHKSCGKNPVQLWFCVILASRSFAQLWFCLKCAPFVKNRRKTLKLCKAVLDKTCNKQRAKPCGSSKLAPSHTTQLSFCFKLAPTQLSFFLELASFVKQPDKIFTVWPIDSAKEGAQLKIYLSWCKWTIKSKKLWFAVLDKTCKKKRTQPCCCSKLPLSQTAQLSFCSKLGRIVRKVKPVRNCVRNCPVNWNWCLLLKS